MVFWQCYDTHYRGDSISFCRMGNLSCGVQIHRMEIMDCSALLRQRPEKFSRLWMVRLEWRMAQRSAIYTTGYTFITTTLNQSRFFIFTIIAQLITLQYLQF